MPLFYYFCLILLCLCSSLHIITITILKAINNLRDGRSQFTIVLNISCQICPGAISKAEVSINETLQFDVVVKYSVSSVVLSNLLSVPLKYCGWVHQCVMALGQSGDREIEGIQ